MLFDGSIGNMKCRKELDLQEDTKEKTKARMEEVMMKNKRSYDALTCPATSTSSQEPTSSDGFKFHNVPAV